MNRHGAPSTGAVVGANRPVLMVRYQSGVVGEAARAVHVIALPTIDQAGAVSALCGAVLMFDDVETVAPGTGMPCPACIVIHMSGTTPDEALPVGDLASADAPALVASGLAYHEWGWPVTRHHNQVRLSLHSTVSALAIPIPLSTEVTQILTQRQCAPAVLVHPDTPEHHIVATGENHEVPLPWPSPVRRVTGALLLPPAVIPRGPITWYQPPREHSLRLCREIDVFIALRTVLRDFRPGDPPLHGGSPTGRRLEPGAGQ